MALETGWPARLEWRARRNSKGKQMTSRAIDFMHRWIDKNIVEDQYLYRKGLLARAFIARCHEELAEAGISPEEIIGNVEATVETIIIEAMEKKPTLMFAIRTSESVPAGLRH